MPAPTLTSSMDVFVDFNDYCTAALLADPEAKDLVSIPAAAGEKLEKAAGGRTEGKRNVTRATARRDFSFRRFVGALETFERKARGELPHGIKDPRYGAIFTSSLAQFVRVPIEDREAELDPLVIRITDPELPKELEKPGKAVEAAWKAYQGSAKDLVAAQAAFDKSRGKEEQAKVDYINATHKVEGKLTDRFADDLPRVRAYFPPRKIKDSDEKRIERAEKRAKKAEERVQKAKVAAEKAAAAAKKAAEKAAAKAKVAAEKAARLARITVPTPGPVASGTAGAVVAPAGAVAVPAGAVAAPAGAVVAPAGAVAAPAGAAKKDAAAVEVPVGESVRPAAKA